MKFFKKALLGISFALFAGSAAFASEQSDLNDQFMSDVVNGNIEAIKAHIAAGVNVNAKNEFGFTALIRAAENGSTDIVKVLIDNGAARDYDSLETAFMTAVYKGDTDVVKVLINEASSINNDSLETAYMIALNFGHTEIVNAIKDHRKKGQ